MSKYNINTTECMQKALCTYIQSTEQAKEKSGMNNFVDSTVNALTKCVKYFCCLLKFYYFLICVNYCFRNSMMKFMIDGSRFNAVLEAGKNGDCGTAYRQCPFDQNSIYMFLRQISNKT